MWSLISSSGVEARRRRASRASPGSRPPARRSSRTARRSPSPSRRPCRHGRGRPTPATLTSVPRGRSAAMPCPSAVSLAVVSNTDVDAVPRQVADRADERRRCAGRSLRSAPALRRGRSPGRRHLAHDRDRLAPAARPAMQHAEPDRARHRARARPRRAAFGARRTAWTGHRHRLGERSLDHAQPAGHRGGPSGATRARTGRARRAAAAGSRRTDRACGTCCGMRMRARVSTHRTTRSAQPRHG